MRLLVLSSANPKRAIYMIRFSESLCGAGHFLYGTLCPEFDANLSIESVIEKFGPFDGILTMEQKFLSWMPSLDKIKLPKILLATDYFRAGNRETIFKRRLRLDNYNIVLFQTMPEINLFNYHFKGCVKYDYLPMSVDTDLFDDFGFDRPVDVEGMWNAREDFYPLRNQLKSALLEMKAVTTRFEIERDCFAYVNRLNRAKIFVNGNSIYGNIQSRFTEVPAAGCLLITDPCTDDLKAQGWKDGENIVLFKSISEMTEKVKYYLSHDSERLKIIANARSLVLQSHSNKVRVKQLEDIFKSIL